MVKDAHETLLIRIDERQKAMSDKIDVIDAKMKCFVMNDDEFKDLKGKMKTLWDERNKLIGWMMGAGVIGGSVSVIAQTLVKTIQAKF